MATVEKRPELMTLDQVAASLRLPEPPVRDHAVSRRIPGRQIVDQWRFSSREAIGQWLCTRSGKDVLLRQAGALEDDRDDLESLRESIYRDRGRSETE